MTSKASTPDADEPAADALKARAVRLLARREHSRAELRSKLLRGGGADASASHAATVDALLDDLAAGGYLSDARYAQTVVRRKGGAYSAAAIGATLKASGVPPETVAEALASRPLDDDEALRALWSKRFGKPPESDREKARQVRFLQSRGFTLSAVLRLLRAPPGLDAGES